MPQETHNADRARNSERGGNNRQAMGGGARKDALPTMQRRPDQKNGPVFERNEKAGWDRVVLLALQFQRGRIL